MPDSSFKMPDKLKMELKTSLEKFFQIAMFLSVAMIFIGFQQTKSDNSALLLMGSILAFVLAFIGYFATDNYYILDLKNRLLVYRFKFLFWERLSKVVDFSGVHAVTVTTSSVTAKGKTSYFHVVSLALFNGKVLVVSDPQIDKTAMRKLAEFISKSTGAQYVPGQDQLPMSVAKLPGGRYTFKRVPVNSAAKEIIEKIVAVIIILLGIPFIALTIYHFVGGKK